MSPSRFVISLTATAIVVTGIAGLPAQATPEPVSRGSVVSPGYVTVGNAGNAAA